MSSVDAKALPAIQLVVPTFNEEEHICASLDSLRALDYPTDLVEIIVVDNGSTDGTCRLVKDSGLKLLRVPGVNVGAVRNAGARESNADLIGFIDGDCVAPPDWLNRGLKVLRSYGADAVGGASLLPDQSTWVERAWVLADFSGSSPKPATILQGCAILITRKAFEQVGGFDESIVAGEDTLLYEALKKERYNVMFDPRLSVVHMGYPDTLRAFTYRQFWHASDYIRSNKGLFNDLTYLGTWASVLFLLAFVICLPFSPLLSAMLVMIWAILPLLLSLKRLKKANWPRLTPLKFVQVYLLDVCYLLGRTLGLLKSLLSKDSSI